MNGAARASHNQCRRSSKAMKERNRDKADYYDNVSNALNTEAMTISICSSLMVG